MPLAEPAASLQGAKAKAKHSPEQPGPGKSRMPAQNNDTFLATSTALWLYVATSTAAVTSITSCRNQHLGGRQAASLCCQMGIRSASKLCARFLLAPPGKQMSHHKAKTKTPTKPQVG